MKVLIVCNTVYQVFVATWLKIRVMQSDNVDIVISDHMNDSDLITKNIKKTSLFSNVYKINSKELCKKPLDRCSRYKCIFYATSVLKRYIKIDKKYDCVFFANVDIFSKLLFHTLANDIFGLGYNKNIKLFLFEDGTSTYSKLFEEYYKSARLPLKRKLPFYKPQTICGNVSAIYAFDPSAFVWKPESDVITIPKIDIGNNNFRETVNTIFDYQNMTDVYDKKYILMEESFYAENGYMEDIELVQKISKIVGKENIMVKIHPRNIVNRFEELGYKTNKNTAIPWEVILLNNNFTDKVILSVASQSVLSPAFLFDESIKSYILFNCLKNKPQILKGDLWDCSQERFKKYDNIKIIKSIDEIEN